MLKNGPPKPVSLSPEIKAKLKTYEALLKKWQPKINLISNNTLNDAWTRHFEDSIQIADLIPEGEKTLFDLGSGAGFPGLVLAIMRPDIKAHLVESDQKKCSFLKTVSRETDSHAEIHNERIEAVSREITPDIITARALAPLDKLFDYCRDWIERNDNIMLIFPKGEKADGELAVLKQKWRFDCRTCPSKTDPNAKIYVFSSIYSL
jgi:16S rRNA (guanine527-N7)-methyltransferase